MKFCTFRLYVLDDVTHQESIYTRRREARLPAAQGTTLNDGQTEGAVLADLKGGRNGAGQRARRGHSHPAPHVLAALKRWSQERDKDIRLVPLRLQPVEEETFASEDIPSERQDDPTSPIEH
ncbi:MAG: hypothetical protein ACLSHC_16775 [Bilophila wadsworthia]